MKKSIIVFSMMLFSLLAGHLQAESSLSGAKLFENHGCFSCHGSDAKNPVSEMIPRLAGKSADELFANAKKLLAGEGGTKESQIVHAVYSPSQCDNPPTDEELHAITAWISQR